MCACVWLRDPEVGQGKNGPSLQAGGKVQVLLTSRRAWVRLSWGRGGGGGRRMNLCQGRKGAEVEEKKRFADQMRDAV